MIESVEQFVALRTSDDPQEYGRAAAEAASVEVWLEVVRQRPDMRFWVAQNKTVPLEILAILARDEDDRVRSMVASKRKLSLELFKFLAVDPDEGVRASLARNARVPQSVLQKLMEDQSSFVRAAARRDAS